MTKKIEIGDQLVDALESQKANLMVGATLAVINLGLLVVASALAEKAKAEQSSTESS